MFRVWGLVPSCVPVSNSHAEGAFLCALGTCNLKATAFRTLGFWVLKLRVQGLASREFRV